MVPLDLSIENIAKHGSTRKGGWAGVSILRAEGVEEEEERRWAAEGRGAALGGRRLGPTSAARVSLRMVGCAPSLAFLSFLLPLINISQASLMTRIGLRLGGKHSSVSHQVSRIVLKKKNP